MINDTIDQLYAKIQELNHANLLEAAKIGPNAFTAHP